MVSGETYGENFTGHLWTGGSTKGEYSENYFNLSRQNEHAVLHAF